MAKNYAGRRGSLLPYGNARPLGGSITTVSRSRGGRGRSAPSTYALPITSTGRTSPVNWWIEGAKRRSPTAPTSASATRHNAIINKAFTVAGY